MASVKAGVVTAVDVNSSAVMSGQSVGGKLADPGAASTWALIWFVVAIVILFFVL